MDETEKFQRLWDATDWAGTAEGQVAAVNAAWAALTKREQKTWRARSGVAVTPPPFPRRGT